MRIQVLALPFLLVTGVAEAQNAPPGAAMQQPAASDRQFLEQMLPLNDFEIRLGQLAAERGSTPELRAKGKKMLDNHRQLGGQLQQYASRFGVTAPSQPSAAQQAELDKLAALSGPAFDSAFQRTIDDAHAQARSLFENQVSSGSDPGLKALAEEKLAKLKAPSPR
jgi:putative membrane protein